MSQRTALCLTLPWSRCPDSASFQAPREVRASLPPAALPAPPALWPRAVVTRCAPSRQSPGWHPTTGTAAPCPRYAAGRGDGTVHGEVGAKVQHGSLDLQHVAQGAACVLRAPPKARGCLPDTAGQATVIWTHNCETDVWQLLCVRTFRDKERGVWGWPTV